MKDALFVITDVETTGLSASENRITEVAAVYLHDGEIVDERHTLVNPGQFIPQQIQELTGITNAMVLGAPSGDEIYPEVRGWFDEASAFVAHNAAFDHKFLQAAFSRHDLRRLSMPMLCTARLARRLLPANHRYSLAALKAHYGIRSRAAHSALGDARATAEVLLRLLEILEESHGVTSVEEAISFQHRAVGSFRPKPRHVQALGGVLSELPTTPGVYRMIDRSGEILYIGKAKNLRTRVSSYFQAGASHQKKIAEMVRRVREIQTEETGSELGALLLESRLIKQHQPRYNTAQKRIRHYYFVRLDLEDPFPRTTLVYEIEPDGAEYFGPFAGRRSAEIVLDTVAKLFRLRLCTDELSPREDAVACIYHGMGRCGAPCAEMQSPSEYAVEVERVRSFLSSSEEGIVATLEQRMTEHADRLEFEEAAVLRNRCVELRRIFAGRRRIAESINTNNVVIVLPAPERGRRELFMVRFGRLAAQFTVGARVPAVKIRTHLEKIYFDGVTQPPRVEKQELESIRIIASYLNRHRDTGRFVYIDHGDSLDDAAQRVARELLINNY